MAGFFITGTDTGVGKTYATLKLMRFLKANGLSVIGMKPVASGCFFRDGLLLNEDALLLQENSSLRLEYGKLNIYSFAPAASPHIAAKSSGKTVEIKAIVEAFRELEILADCVLVEGVGGFEVPLNDSQRVSDLAKALRLPAILVVGMRLGCLNHAFLTHAAMARAGLVCAGWIANCVEADFPFLDENIATLQALDIPCLGIIPHGSQANNGPPDCFQRDEVLLKVKEQILRRQPL